MCGTGGARGPRRSHRHARADGIPMRYALLIADWPTHLLPNPGLDSEWQDLLARVREARLSAPLASVALDECGQGCWLIPLDDGLRSLWAMCRAVDGPHGRTWGYRVLLFEQKPQWLVARPSQ